MEAVFKIIARGLVLHKRSYLRDGWSILDIIVVLSGLIELVVTQVKLRSLRVLRALRPLKSITVIKSMKKLVLALLGSLPDFVNVAIFLIFIFYLFAILGTHQYNGVFYNACRFNSTPESPTQWVIDNTQQRMCTQTGYGSFSCPGTEYCGNPAQYNIPLSNEQAILKQYMYYGIHNFDNIFKSLQVVFQIVTAEAWSTYMYNLMDVDQPVFAAIYTIVIVVAGSLFLMNLILAVIIQTFIKITKDELEEEVDKINEIHNLDVFKDLNLDAEELQEDDQSEPKSPMFNPSSISKDLSSKNNVPQVNVLEASQPALSNILSPQRQPASLDPMISANKRKTASASINARSLKYQDSSLDPQEEESKDESAISVMHSNQKSSIEAMERSYKQEVRDPNLLNRQPSKHNIPKLQLHKLDSKNSSNDSYLGDLSFLKNIAVERSVIDIFKAQSNSRQLPEIVEPTPNNNPNSNSGRVSFGDQEVPKLEQSIQEKIGQLVVQNGKKFGLGQDSGNVAGFRNALTTYIGKKVEEENVRNSYFQKILFVKQQTSDNAKSELRSESTIRSLATMKFKLSLRRQSDKVSKHYKMFEIEYRAGQNMLYSICYRITQSRYLVWSITISIIWNTVMLSLDKYPQDPRFAWLLEKMNFLFSIIFIIEMLIKMLGLGLKGYFQDKFNIFDCVIVMTSIVDMFVSNLLNSKSSGVITVLRSFRLMRLFKLAKHWKRLQHLLITIGSTLQDVSTFSILLSLFIFCFCLLGLELFAYKVRFDPDNSLDLVNGTPPNSNFDTLTNAFTTVFVVLTADGWSSIYFAHYRAMQDPVPTLFFIGLIIIGQKILLNLFLAILLQNFDENTLKEELQNQLDKDVKKITGKKENEWYTLYRRARRWIKRILRFFTRKSRSKQIVKTKDDNSQAEINTSKDNHTTSHGILPKTKTIKPQMIPKTIKVIEGSSLWLFGPENSWRFKVQSIVTSHRFDMIIIFFILVSSVQLAIDSPLQDPNGQLQNALFGIDAFTTSIFCLEAFMKIFAQGFLLTGKSAYLRNYWNQVDFAIIVLSIMSLTPLSNSFSIFKMFRMLRILRLISRNENLRVGLKALLFAIPNIANVTVIMMFFFLIFGIVAVSYFKGKFFFCNTGALAFSPQIIAQKWDCLNSGGEWENSSSTFDNIYNAIGTLFVMATASGWADMMYLGVSATEIDYVQIKMYNPAWIVFFILFMIVGSFFLLNLFVGVVISTFNSEFDRIGGNDMLTEKQKEWIDSRLLILRSQPIQKHPAPKNSIRMLFYNLLQMKMFDNFIFGCIVANTIVLSIKWYNQPQWVDQGTEIVNYLFAAIFITEAIIRITAFGFKEYFKEGWNIFDFIVVIGSIVSIFISLALSLTTGNEQSVPIKGAVTIIRTFRIMRVVRLIKRAKSLQLIFNTFVVTIPALINIGGLLLLLLYLYSVVGVYLFGQVQRNNIFSDNLNFETFGNAFCALCAVATADSWGQIMKSAMNQYDIDFQCKKHPTYQDYVANNYQTVGCGPNILGSVYFYSFYLIVNLIFLNLFIAIVLTGYQDTQSKDKRLFNPDMLIKFKEVWADFDPEGTSFIMISQLKKFLAALGDPLGYSPQEKASRALQDKFIISLQLPTYNGFMCYQFLDILDALSLRLMVIDHTRQKKLTFGHKHMKKQGGDSLDIDSIQDEIGDGLKRFNTQKEEQQIKHEIQLEINKLLFHEDASEILAVKEVMSRQHDIFFSAKKDGELTSVHQAAAEFAINRMKRFVHKRKKERQSALIELAQAKSKLGIISEQNTQYEGSPDYINRSPTIQEEQKEEDSTERGVSALRLSVDLSESGIDTLEKVQLRRMQRDSSTNNLINPDHQVLGARLQNQQLWSNESNRREDLRFNHGSSSSSVIEYHEDEYVKPISESNYGNSGPSEESLKKVAISIVKESTLKLPQLKQNLKRRSDNRHVESTSALFVQNRAQLNEQDQQFPQRAQSNPRAGGLPYYYNNPRRGGGVVRIMEISEAEMNRGSVGGTGDNIFLNDGSESGVNLVSSVASNRQLIGSQQQQMHRELSQIQVARQIDIENMQDGNSLFVQDPSGERNEDSLT